MPRPQAPRKVSPGGADQRLRRALLRWYQKNRRPLPWRASRDAYPVWVSEVMLQQTQVAAVIPYYERFLASFPTVRSLAQAPLERVLQRWSGLGYYRRARQLHAAARMIVDRFEGNFPHAREDAMQLPGVGDYTAAAVLSIAYGVPLAALDGNVARVMARFEALSGGLAEPEFRKHVERKLAALLSRSQPGDFNQALMELGQTICLPKSPRCPMCPVRTGCRACAGGRPEDFPAPRPRRAAEDCHLAAALVACANPGGLESRRPGASRSVLVVRGLDEGLMGDLWNFPSAFGASSADARARLGQKLASLNGATLYKGGPVVTVNHNITYRQINVCVYRAAAPRSTRDGTRWLALSRFRSAAVSKLAQKIAHAAAAALD